MESETSSFVNVAMWSGGRYSAATKGSKDVIDGATRLVVDAIHRIPDPDDPTRPFTLTDMGCADGGTSLDMVRSAAAAVRARWPRRAVWVVYADQPRNDYNSLFQLIHGLTPNRTYMDEIEDVHVLASASTFYRQIVPTGTLDLGFSATAMHWLSRKPCDLAQHVHAVGARKPELRTFAEQGRQDWETILLQRAEEMVPGGRLVLVNFCKDEAGCYLGNTSGVNMFDTFNALWKRFADQGIVSSHEYLNMTFPQYYRTVEEFTQPLLDQRGLVYRAGLRLEQCKTRIVPCPFAAEFREHGDVERFAHDYIPTLRSWTESTFMGALSAGRSLDERKRIIDRYYDAYQELVRDNPAGHRMDYVHAYMTISKPSGV